MEVIYYFILIVSFLAFFKCLLAFMPEYFPPGTAVLQHFYYSACVRNCTTSTCSLMQHSQNFTTSAANHAVGLRSSINPFLIIPLPAITALGNKMLLTRGWFVFLQSGQRDSCNFIYTMRYLLPHLSIRD